MNQLSYCLLVDKPWGMHTQQLARQIASVHGRKKNVAIRGFQLDKRTFMMPSKLPYAHSLQQYINTHTLAIKLRCRRFKLIS